MFNWCESYTQENWNERLKSFPPRYWNTGLVSSGYSLSSWQEGASLTLIGHPSSDGVTIKIPYDADVLHRPALHLTFS